MSQSPGYPCAAPANSVTSIAEPDDAAYVLANTEGVVGFFGASSMERLPTETAMTENMRRFKAIPI